MQSTFLTKLKLPGALCEPLLNQAMLAHSDSINVCLPLANAITTGVMARLQLCRRPTAKTEANEARERVLWWW